MEKDELLHLEVRAKFQPVSWEDLKVGQTFFYFLMKETPSQRQAHGPFVMLDPATLRIRNAQGVEVPFQRYSQGLQPLIFVGVD